jgi:hypothetical protein
MFSRKGKLRLRLINHPKNMKENRAGADTFRALEYILNPDEAKKIVDDRYLMDNEVNRLVQDVIKKQGNKQRN